VTADRIEKKSLPHAPPGRVWHAVSDAAEFGRWFGVASRCGRGEFLGAGPVELRERFLVEAQPRRPGNFVQLRD
jgi:uncharacterized protein YndB with AHSA1/START domain